MPTLADLGRLIKAQHLGEYDHLPDDEVGRRVKAKFPSLYANFTDTSLVPKSPAAVEYLPPTSTVLSAPPVYSYIDSQPITADETQHNYQMLSYGLWAVSILLIATLCSARSGAAMFGQLVLGVATGVAASSFAKKAKEAYETEERETRYAGEIKSNHTAFRSEVVREQRIEQLAQREAQLAAMRQAAEAKAVEVSLGLLNHEQQSIASANQAKLPLDVYKRVAEAKAMKALRVGEKKDNSTIELAERREEINQDMETGDRLATASQSVLQRLTDELVKTRRKRHQVQISKEPKSLKQDILNDYDKLIRVMEGQYEAEAGRNLSKNKKTSRRLKKRATESGTDYPAAIDADDI